MDLVTLVVACGLAARSELFVTSGPQADCSKAPIVTALSATAGSLDPWSAYVTEAAQRFNVPELWVRTVMQLESRRVPSVTSRAGAMGLMQIMPETWDGLRARYGLGTDPYDPRDNILAGAAYIRELFDRYGVPDFLAAYSAGPERLNDHLATGRPLPNETRRYLAAAAPEIAAEMPVDVQSSLAMPPENATVAREPALLGAIWEQDEARRTQRETAAVSALLVQGPSVPTVRSVSAAAQLPKQSSSPEIADSAQGGALFVPLGTAQSRP